VPAPTGRPPSGRGPSGGASGAGPPVVEPCPFCEIAAGRAPAHVVGGADTWLAFLDRRPLFEGHVLVIPRAHHLTLPELPTDLLGPLFGAVAQVAAAVEAATGAEGSFVALNNRVSQSVGHLHVHVVPRRRGDGLRGFFWPRRRYPDDDAAAAVAARIRTALEVIAGRGGAAPARPHR
jgi:histidine triad (HIT) family protein